MKEGDKVKINIREEKRENYCKWLFDGCQYQKGIIEREYPADLKHTSEYEYLVKFDNPVIHPAENWGPAKCQWFNHKDLILL